MRNIKKTLYLCLAVIPAFSACRHTDTTERQVTISMAGQERFNIGCKATLWTAPPERAVYDSVAKITAFNTSAKTADVYVLSQNWNAVFIYMEPGDSLRIGKSARDSYSFSGSEGTGERNTLMYRISQERNRYRKYMQHVRICKDKGKEITKEPVSLEETDSRCRALVDAFRKEGSGNTEAFSRFIDVDLKYYLLEQKLGMPPFKMKTYHPFTPEERAMLEETRKDACIREAVASMSFRKVALAYMDYLRIRDPEGKITDGKRFIRSEAEIAGYFQEGEVRHMLYASALNNIGWEMKGDSTYLAAVRSLPKEWQTALIGRYGKDSRTRKAVIQEFPEIEGEDLEGKKVELKDFRGRWVFIDCWTTHCGPCKSELPYLKQLEESVRSGNLVYMGISLDKEKERETWKKFVKEHDMGGIQILCCRKTPHDQLGITGVPHFALIDPEGRLILNKMPKPSSGIPHQLLKACIRQ